MGGDRGGNGALCCYEGCGGGGGRELITRQGQNHKNKVAQRSRYNLSVTFLFQIEAIVFWGGREARWGSGVGQAWLGRKGLEEG